MLPTIQLFSRTWRCSTTNIWETRKKLSCITGCACWKVSEPVIAGAATKYANACGKWLGNGLAKAE
jgi:hypothetical protein